MIDTGNTDHLIVRSTVGKTEIEELEATIARLRAQLDEAMARVKERGKLLEEYVNRDTECLKDIADGYDNGMTLEGECPYCDGPLVWEEDEGRQYQVHEHKASCLYMRARAALERLAQEKT